MAETKKKTPRITVMDMNKKAPKKAPAKKPAKPKPVEPKTEPVLVETEPVIIEVEVSNDEAAELTQRITDTRALQAALPANDELDQTLVGLLEEYHALTGEEL